VPQLRFLCHEYLVLSKELCLFLPGVVPTVNFLVEDTMEVLNLFLSQLLNYSLTIEALHQSGEELLSMGSDVHVVARTDVLFHLLPVLAVEAESLKEPFVFVFLPATELPLNFLQGIFG